MTGRQPLGDHPSPTASVLLSRHPGPRLQIPGRPCPPQHSGSSHDRSWTPPPTRPAVKKGRHSTTVMKEDNLHIYNINQDTTPCLHVHVCRFTSTYCEIDTSWVVSTGME